MGHRQSSVVFSNIFSKAEPASRHPAVILDECFEDTQCAYQHSHRPHEDDQVGLKKHQLLTSTAYPSGVSVECNVQCFCNPSTDTRAGCDIALQGLASVR
jgi:hypothetical protein